jgi:hypothetical protein
MYDPYIALQAIDQHTAIIFSYLAITVIAVFVYFIIAVKMAIRQGFYVVPFIGAAVFFWHDLSFVLKYDLWFNVYDHWWVELWWYALCLTVPFEAFLIWQFFKYGQKEWGKNLSRRQFGTLTVLATLGVGALWYLIKASIADDLYFITFAITAVFSVPLHSGLMLLRGTRTGQSMVMEVSTIFMLVSMSLAFYQAADFFASPVYLTFVFTMVTWALANCWMISKLPPHSIQRI